MLSWSLGRLGRYSAASRFMSWGGKKRGGRVSLLLDSTTKYVETYEGVACLSKPVSTTKDVESYEGAWKRERIVKIMTKPEPGTKS